MFLRWRDGEYPVDRLDQFSFFVTAPELAKLGTNGAVHEGRIESDGTVADIQFRVRTIDGDTVVCGYVDLQTSIRDRLELMLVERARSPHTDALQTMSYDELALGKTSKGTVAEGSFWAVRSARNQTLAAALLLGVIVSALAWLVWVVRSQSTINVVNGVMAGNYQPVEAPRDGRLAELRVTVGSKIKAGERIGSITILADEREAATVRAKLARAEADLAAYRREVGEAETALRYATQRLQTRRAVALAGEARAAADVKVAESKVKRLKRLLSGGFAKHSDLEEAIAMRDRGLAELRAQRATVTDIAMAERAAQAEVIVYDDRVVNPMAEVRTKVELAAAQVAELRATLALLTAKAKPEELIAPVDGTVFAIYRQAGEILKAADDVIAINRDAVSWATGQVPASQATYVRPGQPVDIDIPSYGIIAAGIVEGIGHRAVHGRDRYSADFRGNPFDVPVRIAIRGVRRPLPSGLRLNMTIRLRDHAKDIREWFASFIG